jgi:predicted nucleotidyltransferase
MLLCFVFSVIMSSESDLSAESKKIIAKTRAQQVARELVWQQLTANLQGCRLQTQSSRSGLAIFIEVLRLMLRGSTAKGTHLPHSDLDFICVIICELLEIASGFATNVEMPPNKESILKALVDRLRSQPSELQSITGVSISKRVATFYVGDTKVDLLVASQRGANNALELLNKLQEELEQALHNIGMPTDRLTILQVAKYKLSTTRSCKALHALSINC